MTSPIHDRQLTFEEFADGIRDGTLHFVINHKQGTYPVVTGAFRKLFAYGAAFANFLPFIAIPGVSYLTHRWIFLFGFLAVSLGRTLATIAFRCTSPVKEALQMILVQIFLIGILWHTTGPLGIFTFLMLCLLYQFVVTVADAIILMRCATKSLISDPEHFYRALDTERIIIVRN